VGWHCRGATTHVGARGARRIAPLWPILNGVEESAWTDAVDSDGETMDISPVLHIDDVIAGKMSTLYTRAEPAHPG
jgi:hypothetical protein